MIRDRTNCSLVIYERENVPRVKWFNREHNFSERSCSNKVQRFIFKFSRLFYVSTVYYFTPFLFILIHQVLLVTVTIDPKVYI